MIIRPYESKDIPAFIAIWNEAVERGEVLYRKLDKEYWKVKFEENPSFSPKYTFVAEENGKVIGFISGICKKVYLGGENSVNTPGFITVVFVKPEWRRKGVGTSLVKTLEDAFRTDGKRTIACDGNNPISLDWTIPGTPGHDHNNAPGVDEECPGFAFLKALGFEHIASEVSMYLNLKEYQPWDGFEAKKQRLAEEGVYIGRYDTSLNYDYDGMCDRVGSEYWREALRSEISCHKENRPNTDIRFLPNGKVPAGPRPILVATCDGHIVAQTGPLDLQDSGRGYFTGICTDPLYERRGIAGVLFNELMQEFVAEGAQFSSIFTGDTNHAQKIYKRTGFQIVRRWAEMKKVL